MSCSQCRVFHGNPVCGACRAAGRVWGILKSGKLPAAEEEKVTLLLRGVAGELSDLLEGALPVRAPTPPLEEADQGGTPAQTPGPKGGTKVKTEDPSPQSCYSYSEEAEEEEPVQESPEECAAPERKEEGQAASPGGPKAAQRETPKEEKLDESQEDQTPPRKLHPNFRPDYLTRRLGLAPCGKASASKERGSRATPKQSSGAESASRHGGADRRERSPSYRRTGRGRPVSPDRPPLPRRLHVTKEHSKARKKAKKKNKGVKRRRRGQEFRAWTGNKRPRSDRRW